MNFKSLFSLKKYRREPLPKGIFEGTVDVHTHLLPGVDDGFQTVDDSLEALCIWAEAGVRGIICTPHFMECYGANRRPTIEEQFAAFQRQTGALDSLTASSPLGRSGEKSSPLSLGEIGKGIHLAAEYMVDDAFKSHASDGFLTLGQDTGLVLTETSYADIHPYHTQLLYNLSLAGYQPVIAHPERYQYASGKQYESWRRKGYKFQLNILSLSGAYGETTRKKAEYMLRGGMYDYVGSDVHNLRTFLSWLPKILLITAQTDALRKLLENNTRLV